MGCVSDSLLKYLLCFKLVIETLGSLSGFAQGKKKCFQVCSTGVIIPNFNVISLATGTGASKNSIHLQKG